MKNTRIWFPLILLLSVHLNTLAVDLESAPEEEMGQIDRSAEELSVEDIIKQVSFTEAVGEPVLDGKLDDEFWQQAVSLSITRELYPERMAEAVVNTDVLAAITRNHIFFGITAHDPQPEKLRSAYKERDSIKDDDYVSVVIDPTGNLRRKFEFRVNPHGVQSDVLQNSISNRYIYDWDTRWQAEARITDSAYVVEIRIPLDSIKQPNTKSGEAPRWLVMLKRSYPRAIDRTFGSVYLFQKEFITLQHKKRKRVELLPYYIFHPDEERSGDRGLVQTTDHEEHEFGLDAKFVFNTATTISATINPNYTEVEADIARESINNPFNPFQPEKRKFFQDGVDLLSTFMPIVYTRNIVQPEFGLGMSHTGRKNSSGGFWMADEFTKLVMPDNLGSDTVELERASDSMALRLATGEKGSGTGLLATARTGSDYHNYVAGVDGLYNLGLDDKIRYQLMYSSTQYPVEFAEDLCDGDDCLEDLSADDCPLGDCSVSATVLRADPTRTLDGHGIRLGYKHDSPDSLYWVNYNDYDDDFRADLGFEKRADYRQLNVAYGRNWFVNARRSDRGKSRLRGYLVGNFMESSAGEQIENGVDLWGEFRGSLQTVFRAGYRIKERAVNRIQQNSLALGDNAPLFDESYLQWYYEASPVSRFTFNLDGRYGDIADAKNLVLGEMLELKPRIRLYIGQFRLLMSHTFRDFDVDGATLYNENFSTLQLAYRHRDKHAFRLLYLQDRTDRDSDRFLKDELEFEKDQNYEFTYLYTKGNGLSILAGAKIKLESDSSLEEEVTDERQYYIKFQFDYRKAVDL